MALPWRRHHEAHPRLYEPAGQPSVADVVHQLQDLSGQLREAVNRLERANERVQDVTEGSTS